jgi:SulP family sulfate permease
MSIETSRPSESHRQQLAGDIWGGLAAALVALPSAVAYGVSVYALLGPAFLAYGVRAGILGAIGIGVVAPLLGGAPRLISAPSAPAAAVMAAFATSLLAGTQGAAGAVPPERIVVLLTLVGLFSGCLQLIYGFVGGGRLIKYIPYPVVSGYLSGVGVIIFLSQVPKFLGWSSGVNPLAGLTSPALWQWTAVVVGSVTIAGVVLAPRLTKAVPASILGLLAGLAAYFGLGVFRPELLQLDHNHLVIGPVGGGLGSVLGAFPGQWSALAGFHWADVHALLMPALTLSVLLSIDTLKTCVVVDALTRARHDSNRALLGQGAGNLAAAALGGMPGSGTMGPTLVNVNSGGRTRLSGATEGICVLAAFVALGSWIAWVPLAALAGILMVVAFRMFDWRSVLLLRQKSTVLDFLVIAAVVVVAVGANLIAASGTGLGLAILLFIREQIRGSVIRRKVTGDRIFSKQHRLPAEQALLEQQGGQITICELQGSLFFGTTDKLFTELEPDLKRCRYLILDMRRVHSVDYTAAHVLEQFEAILKDCDGFLLFSRLPASLPTGQNLKAYFAQVGVMKQKQNVRVFETLDDALQWAEDQILAGAQAPSTGGEPPLALAQIELLRDFEADQMLDALASCLVERSCASGESIFRAGDAGDELFLIRRGAVRIILPVGSGDHHNLASFGRGDFFGEVAFLDRGIRSANAVATTATNLFVISRRRFDELSRAHPVVGLKMYARLARALALRLRRTDSELRALYEA